MFYLDNYITFTKHFVVGTFPVSWEYSRKLLCIWNKLLSLCSFELEFAQITPQSSSHANWHSN